MMTHARAIRFTIVLFTAAMAWAQAPRMALASFHGILKQLEDKTIVLNLDDQRVIEFKRTSKTRFFGPGGETKAASFKTGDAVSVDGEQDMAGFLVALRVTLEKSGGAVSRQDQVFDAWADEPPGPTTASPQQTPSKPDQEDPGPPQLRRGKPADPARERSKPVPETTQPQSPTSSPATAVSPAPATPAPSPRAVPVDEDLPFGGAGSAADSLIRRAADAALDFTATLPNYICKEVVTRYESTTKAVNWHAVDTVTADLVFEEGKEDYRNLLLNGKPVNKKMEDLGGAWSRGEFASVLGNLFSPAAMAQFNFSKLSRIAGVNAREYSFSVTQDHSQWDVHVESQSYRPAYNGRVWIDPDTARVLRIEMEATGLPKDFQTDHVETSTDYEYISLGSSTRYLLPVRAAILSCQTGTYNCFRNSIEFRNYRKFGAESNIQFEDRVQKAF